MKRDALLELTDRLHEVAGIAAMTFVASEVVGRALDATSAGYGTMDADMDSFIIERNWSAPGIPGIAGRYRMQDFGRYSPDLRLGRDVVIPDVRLDPRTVDTATVLEGAGGRAFVNIPVMERGRMVAVFFVLSTTPRRWTAEELAFIREVADRTRSMVERRRAEDDLRAMAASLERQVAERTAERNQIWQVSRDMLMISDAHGRWLSVNPAWTRVLGWTAEELVGRTSEWLEHPEDQAKTRAEIRKLAQGHLTSAFENRFRANDGSYRTLAWSAVPADGLFYCTAHDITAEKASAAALRLFGNIVQSDKAPILAYGPDFRVIGFNQSHEEAFVRVMGRHQAIGDFLPGQFPPEQEVVVRGFMERALSGETFSVIEKLGDPQHEEPIWEITYSPLRDEDGTIFGAFHIARDISDRVKAQEELAGTQEALRQAQKMEAVGQLTGGVAHDFNNLLTVIKSSTDLLKRTNLAEERRARYVAAISDTVDRAAKLTGQLLAFARRQALKPEVFAACASVRALSDMMGTLTGSRIQITTELPKHPSYVEVDPSQFDTALVNLAVNARDAMDGEGRITIAVRSVEAIPAIRMHPTRNGPYVAVSISDMGSGMPAEMIERIFEPFFTTKGVGKGTGLGLSQVFGFVKQSGGDITVDSTVGEGTTFTLYLPKVTAPTEARTDADVEALVDGHGMRVLVVEDNGDVGTFTVQSLTDLGYVTVLVSDAATALDELARDAARFDVVFSDVVMPGMSGIELGQEIRRLYHEMPVVLTSGYSHVLAQNGTYGFELLHKPYSVEQLSQMLRKATTWQRRKRLLGNLG